jgi:hypothetical protein
VKYEKYYVEAAPSLLKYEFYSDGPKGRIKKQVIFKPFDYNPSVYNLGFGDVGEDGEINDTIISDNRDSQKILSTIALTVFKFYEKHPQSYVFITGSSQARTRLYRIGITNNLEEIRNDFRVFGIIEDTWEVFVKGRNYEAFLVEKKDNIFDTNEKSG